jgi:hypothetical protein
MTRPYRYRLPLAGAAAIALALAAGACKPVPAGPYDAQATAGDQPSSFAQLPPLPETLPLISDVQAGGPATPVRYAPTADELPPAELLDYGVPADGYADGGGAGYGFIEQALSMVSAFGDAPPDYGYGYDDSDPWAWQAHDDSLYFAEPIDGGYRSYFYSAGSSVPYLVRDPYYSYGYDDGRLVAVYDDYGRLVPVSRWSARRDPASRYYSRAERLYRASRQRERRAVLASRWGERRPVLVNERRRWEQTRARDANWQRYHRRVADRQQAYWRDERQLRRAEAQRFDRWQQRGFEGARPRLERAAALDNRLVRERAQAERQRSIARAEQRRQAQRQRAERQDDRQRQIVRRDRQADRQQRQEQRAQRQRRDDDRQRGQAERQQRQAERQARQQQRAERQRNDAQRQQRQAERQARQQQRAERQRSDAQRQQRQAERQARQQQRAERQRNDAQRQAERQQQQTQRQQSGDRAQRRAERQQARAAQRSARVESRGDRRER